MKARYLTYLLLLAVILGSCQKNKKSKVPFISYKTFGPPQVRVNTDSAVLAFSFTDGDADLGHSRGGNSYDIYIKDSRYDSSDYVGYWFPQLDPSVLDPEKGVEGDCSFIFLPDMLTPRTDSIHLISDTMHFKVYIMDRAGNKSNEIVTPDIIVTP